MLGAAVPSLPSCSSFAYFELQASGRLHLQLRNRCTEVGHHCIDRRWVDGCSPNVEEAIGVRTRRLGRNFRTGSDGIHRSLVQNGTDRPMKDALMAGRQTQPRMIKVKRY